jgi:vacuolar protein sorting-associated protein 13A/C
MGSINILGNPIGFLKNIEKGMKDFIEKPSTGFVKGPIEGSLGLFKGVGSLLRHSV